MMNAKLKQVTTVTAAAMGGIAFAGAVWAATDYLGIRPVIKNELDVVIEHLDELAGNMNWITYENLARKLANGGLTPRECAKYRALAKVLGVVPKAC